MDRFFEKISPEPNSGCWLWTASLATHGYARFIWPGGQLGHRYSYELHVGPIPEGFEIDHLCRVRSCVNPRHLEPVPHAENVRRTPKPAACPNGHPYKEANVYRFPSSNLARRCRTCRRERYIATGT